MSFSRLDNSTSALVLSALAGLVLPPVPKEAKVLTTLESHSSVHEIPDSDIDETTNFFNLNSTQARRKDDYSIEIEPTPRDNKPEPTPPVPQHDSLDAAEPQRWKRLCGILSGISPIPFGLVFMSQVIKGTASANRISWGIWAANDTLLLATALGTGDSNTWMQPTGFVAISLACLAISLRYGSKKPFNRLDKTCIGLSILGMVTYGFSMTSYASSLSSKDTINLLANVAGCAVNMLAAIPTIRDFLETEVKPEFESTLPDRAHVWGQVAPWTLAFIGPLLNVLSVNDYSVSTALQPVTILFTGALLLRSAIQSKVQEVGMKVSLYALFIARRSPKNKHQ